MANWIEIGDRKLNLDQVVAMRKLEDGSIRVVFPGLGEVATEHNWTFKGNEAKQIWEAAKARDASQ